MCACPWQNQIHEANCSNAGEVKFCTRSYKLIHPFKNKFSIYRAAKLAGIGELDSSIAKDLIDSEDPKHTLFCRKIAFAAIYALFRDNPSFDSNKIDLPLLMNH